MAGQESTQLGDKEFKEYEKDLRQEKDEDDRIDKKIRELRKQKNKARLHPTKPEGPETKRRKITDKKYVAKQEIWGKPDKTEPIKTKITQEIKQQTNKRIKLSGQDEINEDKGWERLLEKIEKKIEDERQEKTTRENEKNAAWELHRLCRNYLNENFKAWDKRRKARQEEFERQERLQKGRVLKRKAQINELEKKIEVGMTRIPQDQREKMEEDR